MPLFRRKKKTPGQIRKSSIVIDKGALEPLSKKKLEQIRKIKAEKDAKIPRKKTVVMVPLATGGAAGVPTTIKARSLESMYSGANKVRLSKYPKHFDTVLFARRSLTKEGKKAVENVVRERIGKKRIDPKRLIEIEDLAVLDVAIATMERQGKPSWRKGGQRYHDYNEFKNARNALRWDLFGGMPSGTKPLKKKK